MGLLKCKVGLDFALELQFNFFEAELQKQKKKEKDSRDGTDKNQQSV